MKKLTYNICLSPDYKTYTVQGYALTFPQFPGFFFAVGHEVDKEGEKTPRWRVTELDTGAYVAGTEKTRVAAITAAGVRMIKYTPEALRRVTGDYIHRRAIYFLEN